MTVLLHIEGGRVVESVNGTTADLARLAQGEGHVAWYDPRLELRDPATWPELLRHPLEILHVGCFQRTDLAVRDLGRVDFDSPFLLPGPTDRRYPTWLIAPAGGVASAALIRALGLDSRLGLATALLDLGRQAQKEGLFLYSEPALLAGPVPDEIRFELDREELAALIARGYGRQWLGFWALAGALYDRSLPPVTGWQSPARPAVDRGALARLHPVVSEAREEIDAVIPTLGRPGPLRDLLTDLAAQTVPPRRVIVIEQRPPGTEPAALDGDWSFELVVRTVEWTGACRARNLAIQEVRSPWVLLLDDDVRLRADALALLLGTARAYGVGAVTAAVHLAHQEPVAGLPRVWSTFGAGATLVEAAALREAGPFDERLEGGYGEDAEIGIRLRQAGCNVVHAPAVRVLHLKAPSGGFRHAVRFPWHDDPVQPRPSPIFLFSRNRHATPAMQQGYRLFYALNRLRSVPALARPGELLRILRGWERSAHWAERLEGGAA